jgi:hypothetical protein
MHKIQLLTYLHQIDELSKLVDTKAARVSIDTQLLRSLLIDHSKMFDALSEANKVIEPQLQKRREKLN